MAGEVPLYTIGYEGRTPDAFLETLVAAGVKQVIDTRDAPISRKRGFSKTPLLTALATQGIAYVHLKALGTPKPMRDAHKASHDHETLARDYAKLLDERVEPMYQAYKLALAQPSALLCYEAAPAHCHRSVLARRMAALFREPAALVIVDL